MKVIGRRINSTATERKCGQMELSSKGTILTERNKERGHLHGQTEVLIEEIFTRTIFMEEVFTVGQMEGSITGRGSAIKCMDMGYSHGLMEESMRGNMWMTRNRGKGCFSGQMGGNILEDGTMGSSMGRAFIFLQMEGNEKESGM
jgi:hypothetical protein